MLGASEGIGPSGADTTMIAPVHLRQRPVTHVLE